MISNSDVPADFDPLTNLEPVPSRQSDPLRVVVQAALVVYLSPVILVVFLIGGASVLAGGAAGWLKKAGQRPEERENRIKRLIAGSSIGKPNQRLLSRRRRTHAAH